MRFLPQALDLAEEMALFDETGANARRPRRDRLVGLRDQVSDAYARYPTPGNYVDFASFVADLRSEDAEALKSNYSRFRANARKDLGPDLLSRSKTCCLCWQAPSGQLDHHLPQSLFPEFAVLTLNLIPVCGPCNHAKGDSYRRDDGGPAYLHAYRDFLPLDEQFLVSEINVGVTVTADFRVVRTPKVSEQIFATLEHHFQELQLADTYGILATEAMMEKLTPVYEYFDEGGAARVALYLRAEARGVVKARGLNHWRSVLLNALAEDLAFCGGGFASLGSRDESIFDLLN